MRYEAGRAWIFIAAASAFQVAWIVSLRFMSRGVKILPIGGYLLSGLGASVFLALAMRSLPMSTSYAAWMGLALVGALLVDRLLFHEPWSASRIGWALLILIGVCGLRLTAPR